jgi:hypothetical protein
MSYNDPTDVESVLQQPTTPAPVISGLTPVASGVPDIGAPGLGRAVASNATIVGTPTPPTLSPDMLRQQGLAAANELPRAVQVNVPAPAGVLPSVTPVPVGAPTLATAPPIQAPASPRGAGQQLVASAVPATQSISQLTPTAPPAPTQTASQVSATQTLTPINTMTPQP